MRNPFRSEEAAFRFLLLVIAFLGLVAVASLINRWAGLAVFLLETGALLSWWLTTRSGVEEEPIKQVPATHAPGHTRVLVVANETVGGTELLNELKRRARDGKTEVLVVTPALNSPLKHWVSDEDGAREAAGKRLDDSLEAMRAAGMTARGEIGDADPLQAIEDALRTFAPDTLVISTHPAGRSHWLERDVVEGAKQRFDLPVIHVVVDLEATAEPAA